MTDALTNETKNTVALTLEAKRSRTWAQATVIWKPGEGTWGVPGTALTPEAKNTVALTNEAKA